MNLPDMLTLDMPLLHTCHFHATIWQDLLLCHDLLRPIINLLLCMLLDGYHHSVMLSFDTKHDVHDFVIIMFTGILSCYYGTKCHTEQSATPHGGGHLLNLWGPPLESIPQNKVPHGTKCHTTRWGPPLESVGATS